MKVTFAGIDETISLEKLLEIEEKYPEVEFAFLLSNKGGTAARYPSLNYLNYVLPKLKQYAVHLCGGTTNEFLTEGKNYKFYPQVARASRVQINKKDTQIHRKALTLKTIYPNLHLIQPVSDFSEAIDSEISLLWDKSGGRGLFFDPHTWPSAKCATQPLGFAGGISPDNIEKVKDIIDRLVRVEAFNEEINWIDMESGIRDSEGVAGVSVEKINKICEVIYGY